VLALVPELALEFAVVEVHPAIAMIARVASEPMALVRCMTASFSAQRRASDQGATSLSPLVGRGTSSLRYMFE
jgi:hypothetical protein